MKPVLRYLIISFLFISFLLFATPAKANSQCEDPIKDMVLSEKEQAADDLLAEHVNIYLFHSELCPHCKDERAFLSEYVTEMNGKVKVYEYEIYFDKENSKLLQEVVAKLGTTAQYVPFTVICGTAVTGFTSDGITETKIRNLVSEHFENIPDETSDENVTPVDSAEVTVPLIGRINLSDYSLPVITVILGFLDGFNPCAMWVLLYLISLLLGMKNKKKMWIIGITFIASSAFVYFLFMTSWLNLFLFLGFIKWVRILIGGIAIASGAINLKEYWDTRPGCKVTDEEQRRKIQNRINKIVSDKRFWMVIVGIITLAFSVNLIELVCSAGFPAIYTHMLSISNLSTLQYYLYLILYVFIFMLDDLVIFIIAMVTLRAIGIATKYKRISSLVGGILILLIGLLLIFRPEVLMFS